jgi:PAS domain S-box-containing protein
MNATSHPEDRSLALGPWARIAWLPIPLGVVIIASLWATDQHGIWPCRPLFWLLAYGPAALAVGFIVIPTARSFAAYGQRTVLMLGCGMWVNSLGVVGGAIGAAHGLDRNWAIYDSAYLLAALCHGAGVAIVSRPGVRPGQTATWLAAAYGGGLAAVALTAWAACTGRMPAFYLPGQGGTLVRTLVVSATVALFLLNAGLLWQSHRRTRSPFLYWYALGLALIATGLAGSMLIPAADTALQWTTRSIRAWGTVYLCVAVLAEGRSSGTRQLPLAALAQVWWERGSLARLDRRTLLAWGLRYGSAPAAVAAGLLLRLAFTARFGSGLPSYITYYPAVMTVGLLAGLGPGLLASALAGLAAVVWGLGPGLAVSVNRLGLVLFLGMGLFTSVIAECYRRARNKAAAYDREVARRESEGRFRVLADAIPHLCWMADADGWVFWYNQRWYEYTGARPGQMEGWAWRSVHDPEVLPRVMERWQASIKERKPFEMVFPMRGADGRFRPFLTRVMPLFAKDGAVSRWFGTHTDITEREQAEMERAATIDLLSLVNASATTRDLISAVTAHFQKLSGCEAVGIRLRQGEDYPYYETRGFPAAFVQAENCLCARDGAGQTVRDRCGDPVLECMCGNVICGRFDPERCFFTPSGSFWTNSTTRLLQGSTVEQRQARTRNRCNGEGYESVVLIPLCSGGERMGLLQMNDRRPGRFSPESVHLWERLAGHVAVALAKLQVEQELRTSEAALREADQRKDEFLAVLSHELRNPLGAIANSIYLLDHGTPGSEPVRRAQTVIGRQTRQLSRLVDDLLDVTRISRNKIQLQFERMDLVQSARGAIQDQRGQFEAQDVRLDFAAPDGAVWVMADAARLTQMLGNLIFNAGKFTDPGGTVTLEVQARGTQATVAVTDTGIGMDEAMLGRLFQPFAQADRSLDRSRGGLGLGLALAKGLAELHGGTVSASSPGLGKGSRFLLTLPAAPPPEGRRAAGPAQASPVQPHRILVIEDNVDAALTLKLLLEFSGHQVFTAHSGREGIAKARTLRPEVILCDIGLPDTDGYMVARTLRAEPGFRPYCLMVAMTGYGQPEDKQRALEAGFDHHLTKPADPSALNLLLDF